MFILKTLKNAPICFDHYSDNLQGARRFLVKVTEFKIFQKCKRSIVVMRQHNVWCVCYGTHTKRYAAASPQLISYTFKKF